jgi:hypothetical protein
MASTYNTDITHTRDAYTGVSGSFDGVGGISSMPRGRIRDKYMGIGRLYIIWDI